MHNYKQLEVWKRGIELASAIYIITKKFPKEEKFGIVSQMRRCSVSISSNIAEGAGRNSDKEFRQFLNISFGSCSELETQLIISENIGYILKEELESILSDLTEIQKMIFTLIKKFS
ncbi:MAG: four helix bundle protein [Balneola sp.]|jgi:four helix bundle protein|nr:four helix bundle protein [Balneola sp.]MBE78432.1 four helix bundle protein [Balneola sp.]HBX66562.1 four helix bundle protein [Balneolaceae bacterium]|tara:strand:- start:184 stop:534 length:351 start_codon:yes stop_codon:yes gene_type:complete